MTKAELRSKYLKLRSSLTELEYRTCNEQLCSNFFSSVDLTAARILHTYLPIAGKHEPDTNLIIAQLATRFPGIQLSIPRMRKGSNDLESVLFSPGDPIAHNAWGIPEPIDGVIATPDRIDAVIVPLLAFDEHGNRVGYGKGFYDKFLATCRKDARKIGLSAFIAEPVIENLSPLDIALDLCITPLKTYHFSKK